jgi:hypothetical protein
VSRLERDYRRLLLAYPREYRRARGDEIVTTLMEATPPDRVRPHAGDAWDLVRGGLRKRFAPPRGRGYAAVALACAAAVAYVALGGAIRLATGSEASIDTQFYASADLLPPEAMLAGDADRTWTTFGGPTQVELTFAPQPRALDDLAAEARARAVADGWVAGPIEAHRFTLDRAGQTMVVTIAQVTLPEPAATVYFTTRYPWPAPLLPAGIAAVVLGGLAGWLAGAWTLRRYRSRTPAGQLLIALTGAPGLWLLAAAAVGTVAVNRGSTSGMLLSFTGSVTEGLGLAGLAAAPLLAAVLPAAGPVAFQPAASQVTAQPAASQVTAQPAACQMAAQPAAGQMAAQPAAGQVTTQPAASQMTTQPAASQMAAAGQVAAQPAAGPVAIQQAGGTVAAQPAVGSAAAPRPRAGLARVVIWAVTVAHLAFGVAIATVLVTYTARMLATGADRVAMVMSGANDPKDLLPPPVYGPIALLYYTGVVLSPLLLLLSVPMLAIGRTRVGPVAWRMLLAAAISGALLPALLLTPLGGDAAYWWNYL